MKKILLVLAALMTASLIAGGAKGRLVWSDEFNDNRIDTTAWSKVPRGGSDWNRHMTDFDSCYVLRDGCLVLRGIRNYSLPNDTMPFVTGGVKSAGKKSFAQGRVEVRAKLGEGIGVWPAIWMLPEKSTWPSGGEIDIMEHLNHDTIAYQTIHTHYTYDLGHRKDPRSGFTAPIINNEFNVYAVDFRRDSLTFFINDEAIGTYPRIAALEEQQQYPFGVEPFYIILSMQIEGAWVGKADIRDLPVEMLIDWVRVYE